jgi:hypothetical protein
MKIAPTLSIFTWTGNSMAMRSKANEDDASQDCAASLLEEYIQERQCLSGIEKRLDIEEKKYDKKNEGAKIDETGNKNGKNLTAPRKMPSSLIRTKVCCVLGVEESFKTSQCESIIVFIW